MVTVPARPAKDGVEEKKGEHKVVPEDSFFFCICLSMKAVIPQHSTSLSVRSANCSTVRTPTFFHRQSVNLSRPAQARVMKPHDIEKR